MLFGRPADSRLYVVEPAQNNVELSGGLFGHCRLDHEEVLPVRGHTEAGAAGIADLVAAFEEHSRGADRGR